MTIMLYFRSSQGFLDPTRPTSPSKPKAMVSVQSFPSPTFLADHTPEGHSGLHPQLMPRVNLSDVFSLAPQVAARMVLEREEVGYLTFYPPDNSFESVTFSLSLL